MTAKMYPTIYVDPHEKNRQILYLLDNLHLDWQFLRKKNEVGDYFIGDIVIELKSNIGDLISSIEDGRANNQVFNLSASCENSYFVILGDLRTYRNEHHFKIEPLIAQLASLSMRRSSEGKQGHVNVLMLYSEYEFVLWLKHIQKRAFDKTPREPIAPKLTSITKDPYYSIPFLIQQTPDAGETLTRSLLTRFGSIEALVNATPEELAEVRKIAKKKAQKIYDFYRIDWRSLHYKVR